MRRGGKTPWWGAVVSPTGNVLSSENGWFKLPAADDFYSLPWTGATKYISTIAVSGDGTRLGLLGSEGSFELWGIP